MFNKKSNFILMTERWYLCHDTSYPMSALVLQGTVLNGESCFISTEEGVIPAKISRIQTAGGDAPMVGEWTHCLITMSGIPEGINIPYASIISSQGYTREDVLNMPVKMEVVGTFWNNGNPPVIVVKVKTGTLYADTTIRISNGSITKECIVEDIESFKRIIDKAEYGSAYGLFLYGITQSEFNLITEGAQVSEVKRE